jgi:N-acyl homoserine lactone hydrolase
MKIYVLNGGAVDLDRAVLHPGDDSHRRLTVPVPQILIESEGRTVLIDTGMPPIAVDDDTALEREYGMATADIRPLMGRHHTIDAQLGMLRLKPLDVDIVICSHFHFDHGGGNALFAGGTIAVQAKELAVAGSPGYLPVWDTPGLQFDVVDGDWSPFAGVELLFTPGHSAGHQSILVRPSVGRPWLFTIDAVYTEEHWANGELGAVSDVPAARASLERLRGVAAREDDHLIFGHDIVQWESLGMTRDSGPCLLHDDDQGE